MVVSLQPLEVSYIIREHRAEPYATGGWEYQFTEGYPPAPRRRDPSLATVYRAPSSQALPYSPPSVPAGANFVLETHHQPHINTGDDDDAAEDNDEVVPQMPPQVPSLTAPPAQSQAVILANNSAPPAAAATKAGNGSGRQTPAKHTATASKAGKKLSAIVKADKERRVSSRKRIKSWLSEVTP